MRDVVSVPPAVTAWVPALPISTKEEGISNRIKCRPLKMRDPGSRPTERLRRPQFRHRPLLQQIQKRLRRLLKTLLLAVNDAQRAV
jgi:hypothetical protein